MTTRVSDRPVEGQTQTTTTAELPILDRFRREQGVALDLSPRQLDLLKGLDDLHAQAYLGLAAAGVGLVPADATSAKRISEILDAAVQIWAGVNRGDESRGSTPMDRLGAFARLIKTGAAAGPMGDQVSRPCSRCAPRTTSSPPSRRCRARRRACR